MSFFQSPISSIVLELIHQNDVLFFYTRTIYRDTINLLTLNLPKVLDALETLIGDRREVTSLYEPYT